MISQYSRYLLKSLLSSIKLISYSSNAIRLALIFATFLWKCSLDGKILGSHLRVYEVESLLKHCAS